MNFHDMTQEQIDQCWAELGKVTTIPEASFLWNICPGTLLNWCNAGIVIATQSSHNKTWLIAVRSLIHRAGQPVNAPEYER